MREIAVTDADSGGRLDKFLLKRFNAAPPPLIYRLLRRKTIKLNGKKAEGGVITRTGDVVTVYLSDDVLDGMCNAKNVRTKALQTKDIQAAERFKRLIVFENDGLLVINKPPGVLCHSAEGSAAGESLVEMAAAYISLFASEAVPTPALCNRIDRNTSGLVVCGKTLAATREVCRAVATGKTDKRYLAIVKGRVSGEARYESLMSKDGRLNKAAVRQKSDVERGIDDKTAITEFWPLKYNAERDVTLLAARLITGRSHQIRAHAQALGHPIAGDMKYGDAEQNARFRREFGVTSQTLHAWKLAFARDAFAEGSRLAELNGMEFTAQPYETMKKIIETLFKGRFF